MLTPPACRTGPTLSIETKGEAPTDCVSQPSTGQPITLNLKSYLTNGTIVHKSHDVIVKWHSHQVSQTGICWNNAWHFLFDHGEPRGLHMNACAPQKHHHSKIDAGKIIGTEVRPPHAAGLPIHTIAPPRLSAVMNTVKRHPFPHQACSLCRDLHFKGFSEPTSPPPFPPAAAPSFDTA